MQLSVSRMPIKFASYLRWIRARQQFNVVEASNFVRWSLLADPLIERCREAVVMPLATKSYLNEPSNWTLVPLGVVT